MNNKCETATDWKKEQKWLINPMPTSMVVEADGWNIYLVFWWVFIVKIYSEPMFVKYTFVTFLTNKSLFIVSFSWIYVNGICPIPISAKVQQWFELNHKTPSQYSRDIHKHCCSLDLCCVAALALAWFPNRPSNFLNCSKCEADFLN